MRKVRHDHVFDAEKKYFNSNWLKRSVVYKPQISRAEILLVLEKFTRVYLFHIALEIIWFPLQIQYRASPARVPLDCSLFTFLQDINRKRIAQISCTFVKDNQIEFQGVKVCEHLISLLMETNRPSATRLRSRVCLWLCCFVPLSQGKMKQGDFWTALLQNTKRLPPRSVPHQLRAYGTHFPSQ